MDKLHSDVFLRKDRPRVVVRIDSWQTRESGGRGLSNDTQSSYETSPQNKKQHHLSDLPCLGSVEFPAIFVGHVHIAKFIKNGNYLYSSSFLYMFNLHSLQGFLPNNYSGVILKF